MQDMNKIKFVPRVRTCVQLTTVLPFYRSKQAASWNTETGLQEVQIKPSRLFECVLYTLPSIVQNMCVYCGYV